MTRFKAQVCLTGRISNWLFSGKGLEYDQGPDQNNAKIPSVAQNPRAGTAPTFRNIYPYEANGSGAEDQQNKEISHGLDEGHGQYLCIA